MDSVAWAAIALLILLALLRLRNTKRKVRQHLSREEQIQRKLEELKRRRDEDNKL